MDPLIWVAVISGLFKIAADWIRPTARTEQASQETIVLPPGVVARPRRPKKATIVIALIIIIIAAFAIVAATRGGLTYNQLPTSTLPIRPTGTTSSIQIAATLAAMPTPTPSPTATSVPVSTPTSSVTAFTEVAQIPAITPTFFPTPISITPIPAETLLSECRNHTFSDGSSSLAVSRGITYAVQLTWVIPNRDSYAGCTIRLDSSALSAAKNNPALVLRVHGAYDNEPIRIKLTDASGDHSKLLQLRSQWQQVVLVLLIDFPDLNLQELKQLVIGVEYDPTADSRSGEGTAYFGSIGFGSP